MKYKLKWYILSFLTHTRWFGAPSFYEVLTGELYDNKFKSLPVGKANNGSQNR